MAGPFDPFTPGPPDQGDIPGQPPIVRPPEQGGGLAGLAQDPRILGAMLQFGLTAMGPREWGVTPGAQIAQAVGTAGQSVARNEEAARKQQETDIKGQLAEAKANQAWMGANVAQQRLGLEKEKLGQRQYEHQTKLDTIERGFLQKKDEFEKKLEQTKGIADLHERQFEQKKIMDDYSKAYRDSRIEMESERNDFARTRTEQSGQRLDQAGQTQDAITRRSTLQNTVRVGIAYQQEMEAINKANAKIDETIAKSLTMSPKDKAALEAKKQPVPSLQEWVARNPAYQKLYPELNAPAIGGQTPQARPDQPPPLGQPIPGVPTAPAPAPGGAAVAPQTPLAPGGPQVPPGGTGPGAGGWPVPPAAAIAELRARRNIPGEVEKFERHFGPGAAGRALGVLQQ